MKTIVKEIILNRKYIDGAEVDILKKYLYQSHLNVRRMIGILALVLAVGLPAVDFILKGKVGTSISGYYHSSARDFFVGSLCMVGIFLITYKCYDKLERLLTFSSGVLSFAIAFLPTEPTNSTEFEKVIGTVHTGCAITFFILFALLSRLIFIKNTFDVMDEETERAIEHRNIIYGVCNIVLVLDGIACTIYVLAGHKDILVFESIALIAFGLAWIVKGKMIRHLISKYEYDKLRI